MFRKSVMTAIFFALFSGLLVGCGPHKTMEKQPEPGSGIDDYKLSPCACEEVFRKPNLTKSRI